MITPRAAGYRYTLAARAASQTSPALTARIAMSPPHAGTPPPSKPLEAADAIVVPPTAVSPAARRVRAARRAAPEKAAEGGTPKGAAPASRRASRPRTNAQESHQ